MPLARIRYREAEGRLPDVCLRCGGRAVCRVDKTIRLYDTAGAYGRSVLSPLWLLLDLVNYFNSPTLVLRGPFCDRHRHHWMVRRILIWAFVPLVPLTLLGILVLQLLGAFSPQTASALCGISLFVNILVPTIIYGTSTFKLSCNEDAELLVLTNVHARFVDALEKQREGEEQDTSTRREIVASVVTDTRFEPASQNGSPREAANSFAHLADAPDDRPRARRPRRSNPNVVAIVLVAVIGVPLVLFVFLAVLIRIGILAGQLIQRPPAPVAENRREQPRADPPRVEQPPREEERDVEPGTVVPNSPAMPPLPAELEGKPSINLIPLARPRKDVVHGRWLVANKALHCNDGSFVPRIQFPYRPPAEYDFVVTFWQPELRNGISLVMPNPNGGSFFWFLGNEDGAGYGFHAQPNKEGRQPGLIQARSIHTTVVQVRKGSVRAFVDGKELMRLETDYRDLSCDDWRRIHNTDFVAVACDDPTVFYYVRIVEVSGKGKKGR
jgi:hypothetical protein